MITKLWYRLTEPSALILSSGLRRRARLLSSILVVITALSLTSIILVAAMSALGITEPLQWQVYGPAFGAVLLLAFAYSISRTEHYVWAAMITIFSISAAGYVIEVLNPTSPRLTDYLVIGLFLSGLLLSLRATVWVLILNLTLLGLLRFLLPTVNSRTLFDDMTFVTIVGGLILIASKILADDITQIEKQSNELSTSERRYRGLFEDSPISLWEEDFSAIKQHLDDLKQQGLTDIRSYLEAHPEEVTAWAKQVRIIDVNNATLKLYKAESKSDLVNSLDQIFNEESYKAFQTELQMIAAGQTEFEREVVETTLTGERLIFSVRWSVAPGYEETLARVIISVTDITERTHAKEKLEYSSTHDALTQLYNRSFFKEEFERLEQGEQFPVSVVMVDLDHMKQINDSYGHAVGDELLQRTAKLLLAAFRTNDVVARIGGDEFAVLLPRAKSTLAEQKMLRIKELLVIDNEEKQGIPLSLSIGAATEEQGISLTEILKEADDNMYLEKQVKRGTESSG